MQEGEGPELLSCAPAASEDAPKAPWEGLYDTFMPLLISMTFNSPLQFWELNYMQQQNQFDAAAEEQDKVVRTPVRAHASRSASPTPGVPRAASSSSCTPRRAWEGAA